MDRHIIAKELLAAVGGAQNVTANDICMTRLRILTRDPLLIDTDKLSAARGVLGYVKRGTNGIEVVFGPGKVGPVHEALLALTNSAQVDDLFQTEKRGIAENGINVLISSGDEKGEADALGDLALNQGGNGDGADDDLVGLDDLDGLDDLVAAEDPDEAEGQAADELATLLSEISQAEESADEPFEDEAPKRPRVLVINGPNINMLGIREPGIYGHKSYEALLDLCQRSALEAGFKECACFQSNHEGDLVDAIQDAYHSFDGIVINPGAYTHTSIAILDAAKAVGLPMVEVHISKVSEREDFRQVSYIRAACFETVAGLGIDGYRKAIFDLAEKVGA